MIAGKGYALTRYGSSARQIPGTHGDPVPRRKGGGRSSSRRGNRTSALSEPTDRDRGAHGRTVPATGPLLSRGGWCAVARRRRGSAVPRKSPKLSSRDWAAYYRATSAGPPRELLERALEHVAWEGKPRRRPTAIEIGSGSGRDALALLRTGWRVLAIDAQREAAEFLARRVPARQRPFLTALIAPMEDLVLPSADPVYASFSLPFCPPESFPTLWRRIRSAIRPGGHFAGQLFGDRDEWVGRPRMVFQSLREVRSLTRGFKVELLRETEEEGRSFVGPKHWHFFDLILEKT